MRAARLLFALLALAWIGLVVAAPVALLGAPASALTYAFGSVICHQRPERSFYVAAAQLPVCARCFGIYSGAAMGVVIGGLISTMTRFGAASGGGRARGLTRVRIGLVAAAIPTALTWMSEVAGLWSPANLTRFAAAVPLGAAVALTVNYFGCAQPRRTGPNPPPIRI